MNILQSIISPYTLPSLGEIVFNLLLALVLGLVITFVYRWTHATTASKSFTDTLIILCMLIDVVMVVIGNSVARAFSLVGALSIIRFRAVVEDPKDIAFIFFALAAGMATGAGNAPVAFLGTFIIGGVILGLHYWHKVSPENGEFMLTFNAPPSIEFEPVYRDVFTKHLSTNRLIDQRTKKSGAVELKFRVRLRTSGNWAHFWQELAALEGITGVKLKKP